MSSQRALHTVGKAGKNWGAGVGNTWRRLNLSTGESPHSSPTWKMMLCNVLECTCALSLSPEDRCGIFRFYLSLLALREFQVLSIVHFDFHLWDAQLHVNEGLWSGQKGLQTQIFICNLFLTNRHCALLEQVGFRRFQAGRIFWSITRYQCRCSKLEQLVLAAGIVRCNRFSCFEAVP